MATFLVMPIKQTNALAAIMDLMNRVFLPYFDHFFIVFVDDILFYSRSRPEHVAHFQTAWQILREHCLYTKLSKCEVWLSKVVFLEHAVNNRHSSIYS